MSMWLRLNNLKLNVQKTKCVIFNYEGLFPNVELMVDDEVIEVVPAFKFLGVILDQSPSFAKQFSTLYDKLVKSSFVLRSLSLYVLVECLRQLYFAYYHSHLTYCSVVWWPLLNQVSKNCLNTLQKRIVRNVCAAHFRQHCMPLFKKQRILLLSDQVMVENCKLMHHIEYSSCPIAIKHLFPTVLHGYSTRNNVGLNIVVHRSVKVNHSFLCKSVTDWQKMKPDLRQIQNVKIFGKKLKELVLQKY